MEVLDTGSIGIHQELLEVPSDSLHSAIFLLQTVGSQKGVQWVSVLSVDVDLREHQILGSVALSEGLDVSLAAWLLGSELVAREGEDFDSLKL